MIHIFMFEHKEKKDCKIDDEKITFIKNEMKLKF